MWWVAKAVAGLISQTVNIITEAFHRLFGLGDFFLSLLGIMPMKKIRVTVVILRDDNWPLAV